MKDRTLWQNLIVTDYDGDRVGTLGEVMNSCPANLDSARVEDGKITSWPQYFLSADGEEANWATPYVPVDWKGFANALNIARGNTRYA